MGTAVCAVCAGWPLFDPGDGDDGVAGGDIRAANLMNANEGSSRRFAPVCQIPTFPVNYGHEGYYGAHTTVNVTAPLGAIWTMYSVRPGYSACSR
jgi:hypothetical protein